MGAPESTELVETAKQYPVRTGTESRVLSLLGAGLAETAVAAACGISVSRVSQLLSDELFAEQVAELRYAALEAHSARDAKADSLEDKVLAKIEGALPLMFRPMELVKTYQVLNGAKRRGQAAPEHLQQNLTLINLQIPAVVVNKFNISSTKQVINIDGQDLTTMQSSTLLTNSKTKLAAQEQKVLSHDSTTATPSSS